MNDTLIRNTIITLLKIQCDLVLLYTKVDIETMEKLAIISKQLEEVNTNLLESVNQ